MPFNNLSADEPVEAYGESWEFSPDGQLLDPAIEDVPTHRSRDSTDIVKVNTTDCSMKY